MTFDDDLTACAQLVEKGDPLRFRTAMAAPLAARVTLFPLYAFNVEVSRAPWVTQEPMIAEMRLQWWRDALEEIALDGKVRRHEVVTPLARGLTQGAVKRLDQLVAARRWDIYRDAFEDQAHFDAYLDQTAGHLMWSAAEALGATDEAAVRDIAWGAGIAAFLRAVPALEAEGRRPLFDGTSAGVKVLAERALERLETARRVRVPRSALPALWPASGAKSVLRAAIAAPGRVADGTLPEPPSRLWAKALFGRW